MSAVRNLFSPLRNRNLAIYFGGQAISLIGTMMQMTAMSWVVWKVSTSSVALGVVNMLQSLPLLLFGAFGGVLADRLNRRRALIGTQIAAMLLACLFALLLQTNLLQLWHAYVLSFVLGCVNTLDYPTQTAFVTDLAGVTQVRQATVIDQMILQIARMAGPALAGWVMGAIGVTPTFWINGASFLAVIGSLLVVRGHQQTKPADQNGNMKEGFQYVGSAPRIQDLLLFCLALTFFVFTMVQLMPIIVTDFLYAGPDVLGWTLGASGLGSLVGSILIVPPAQHVRRVGVLLALSGVWIGAWMAVVALVPATLGTVIGMFMTSLMAPVILTTSTGLIQMMAPEAMRGRLMAIWMMVSFGTQPLASLLVGYTGRWLGAPGAILLNAACLIAVSAGLLAFRRGLATWHAGVSPA